MCRINEIYYMNLTEFLENWHPDTTIIVKTDSKEIYRGYVKDAPSDLCSRYSIQAGRVTNSVEGMIIPVVHEDEINRRIEEQNDVSFYAILQSILKDTEKDKKIKIKFEQLIESANQYYFYKKNWNQFSVEMLGVLNEKRSMNHDIFISDINALSSLVEEITGDRMIPWRVALGNDRTRLGDFAEYLIDYGSKIKERINVHEAISWAQEHQNQVYYTVEHSQDGIDAKWKIINQFGFSELQASAIVDMRMRAFTIEERKKVEEELQELMNQIRYFPEL